MQAQNNLKKVTEKLSNLKRLGLRGQRNIEEKENYENVIKQIKLITQK